MSGRSGWYPADDCTPVAFTAGDTPALGRVWRITAKKTDFYLDSPGQAGSVGHLSAHGPSERFDGHRFHIKVDRGLAAMAKVRGELVLHGVPGNGFAFSGQQLAAHAFRVEAFRIARSIGWAPA